ncbi:MAG: ribosome-associated translation inhibitor RaiA [Opitutales bacterium]
MKDQVIISGHHLELTEALKDFVREKAATLFRHEPRIIRLRAELEYDRAKTNEPLFTAQGIIEISGPDLTASDTSDNMYRSIDNMIQKLDRMLRNRARQHRHKRDHPHEVEIPAALPKVTDE